MNGDELLAAAGRLEAERRAEREPTDPRWDALAEGRLSPDAAAALEALDPELFAAFLPLSGSAREAVFDAVERELPPAAEPRAADPAPTPLDRLRAGWRAWTVALVPAAALAVALAVWRPWTGDATALPAYAAEISGDLAVVRGSGAGTPERPRFDAASDVRLVLTPDVPVAGGLVARAFLATPDGRLVPAPVTPRVSEQGAVLVAAPARELFAGHAGALELVVVVGRAGELPAPEALQATDAPASGSTWRVARVPVEVLPPP